jgi:hypothetical protein
MIRWLPIALLTVLLAGCSPDSDWPPIYPAGGRVVYSDGQPFTTGGQIEFELDGQLNLPSARAQIQPDGTFRLGTKTLDDGAFVGEHRVVVAPAYGMPESGPSTPPIDHKHLSYKSSGLRYTVTEDESKNHFEVKVDPPRK